MGSWPLWSQAKTTDWFWQDFDDLSALEAMKHLLAWFVNHCQKLSQPQVYQAEHQQAFHRTGPRRNIPLICYFKKHKLVRVSVKKRVTLFRAFMINLSQNFGANKKINRSVIIKKFPGEEKRCELWKMLFKHKRRSIFQLYLRSGCSLLRSRY